MIESFKMAVASTLQVMFVLLNADLDFVLSMGQQAIAVVDDVQLDLTDFERLELVLADESRRYNLRRQRAHHHVLAFGAGCGRLRSGRFAVDFDLFIEADLFLFRFLSF